MRGDLQPGRLHPVHGLLRVVEPHVANRLVSDEGEFIVDEVHHHWVVYVPRMLEALLTLGLLALAAVLPPRFALVVVAVALAVLIRAAAKSLASFVDRFVITNLRVFRSWGLISQQLATMPIQRILDISVVKPVLGRILGYGHFVFESAAQDQGLRDIRFVSRPFERDHTMQRVIQGAGLRKGMESGHIDSDDGDGSQLFPDRRPGSDDRRRPGPGTGPGPGPYRRRRTPVPADPLRPSTEPPYPARPSREARGDGSR